MFCLTATGDGSLNGATLALNRSGENSRQLWHLKPIEANAYELSPLDDAAQAVWIVPPDPTKVNYQPITCPFVNRSNQELVLTEVHDGWYKISSLNDDNIVLSVPDQPVADGTWVMGFSWKEESSQLWYLQPVKN